MATKKYSDNQGKTGKIGGNLEVIVGRVGSPNLDVEINNEMVSGRHLKLIKMGSMVIIEDLGSTNGTTVDGVPLQQGEQKPISFNTNVVLAQSEKLDFNHPLIRPLFEGIVSSPSDGTSVHKPNNAGTTIHSTPSAIPHHQDRGEKIRPPHRYDKFYPPSYNLEEEKECQGEREAIIIRIFSKDSSKLRVIVFGAESEDLIFNEEHSFTSSLDNLRDADEKRKFFKNEIQNFLHIHKKRYCREEIWHHVLTSDGKYKDGGYYKLVSEKFENRLRTKVYINDKHYKRSNEEEKLEFEDAELIDIRAKEVHSHLAEEYAELEKEVKFPVTIGWLNAILKRLPFYKSNPMNAFYLFSFLIVFIFWLLICMSGKYMGPQLPKEGKKLKTKDSIAIFYYGSIEEPLCGNLADKCLAKRDAPKFQKKFCKPYCFHDVMGEEVCNELGISRIEHVASADYLVVAPNSVLGANSGPKAIVFINNTNQDIDVTLKSIQVADEPYEGIIESINGKNFFKLYANEKAYNYEIAYNSSFTKQLEKGEHQATVTFEMKLKNKEPQNVIVNIDIEI